MRIIFSRKGFDSSSGGGASPVVAGRPISLPIPASKASKTSYNDLELGDYARAASRGKFQGDDLCHHDPMFLDDGYCLFGQCGAAQTHLANHGVNVGDVFLFFGLFCEKESQEKHHRIFGYLRIEEKIDLRTCSAAERDRLIAHQHPHALAMHAGNDMIYAGQGRMADKASKQLRLTVADGPPSLWNIPSWLKRGGLTYHDKPERWLPGGQLRSVARGQEFIADIGKRQAPREWLEQIIAEV